MVNNQELIASVTSWGTLNYLKHDNGLLQESWQYELVLPVSIITQTILIAFEYQRYLSTAQLSQSHGVCYVRV